MRLGGSRRLVEHLALGQLARVSFQGKELPYREEQSNGGKHEVDNIVGNKDDAEDDDDQSQQHHRQVDGIAVAHLVVAQAHEQRERDGREQPGILNEQAAGHDKEIVGEECLHRLHTQGKNQGAQRDAHKGLEHVQFFPAAVALGLVGGTFDPLQALGVAIGHIDKQKAENHGYKQVKHDKRHIAHDDGAAPLGAHLAIAAMVGVLVVDGLLGLLPVASQVLQHLEVVVAGVLEYFLLNDAIALLGILVEEREVVVHAHIGHAVLTQCVAQLHAVATQSPGIAQAHGAVVQRSRVELKGSLLVFAAWPRAEGLASLVAHAHGVDHGRRQNLEAVDEAVVAGDFGIEIVVDFVIWQAFLAKLPVKCSGLVAGVGEVKHIVALLRVEHQAYLVALFHVEEHLLMLGLAHLFQPGHELLLLKIGLLQLYTQHCERLFQIFLLQHGLRGQACPQCEKKDDDNFFHKFAIYRCKCNENDGKAYRSLDKRLKFSDNRHTQHGLCHGTYYLSSRNTMRRRPAA